MLHIQTPRIFKTAQLGFSSKLPKQKKKKKGKPHKGSSRDELNQGDSCSPLYENPENSHGSWRGRAGKGERSFLFFSPRATGDLKRDHSRGEFLESTCRGSRTPKTSSPPCPLPASRPLAESSPEFALRRRHGRTELSESGDSS